MLRLEFGPTFNDDLRMMYAVFNSLHPKDELSKEIGLLKNTVNVFAHYFPQYQHEVLKVVAEEFTFRRLKMLNEKAKAKVKGNGGNMTMRSQTKTLHFVH